MILKTTTNEFCFINVSFYETIADPRYFFEQDYEEMPEYEEELDFDFDSYCNKFIPFVQEWANKVGERIYEYGVNNIKVISVGHPKEYNYGTDWMDVRIEFCDEWRKKMLSNIGKIVNDDKCKKVRSIYSKTFTRQRPTNYIIMSWINSDGRGVIRNISQKQNSARC